MEHFSRGHPIACGPINLYQPIHQAMETARARQFSGVRFAEDFDPSLPLVHGNHDAMVQILLNLRSEEHTSELQSLMRISYAVFCLKKKTTHITHSMSNKHCAINTYHQLLLRNSDVQC